MGHTTLAFVFCSLLAESSALYAPVNNVHLHQSFVSADKLWCGEAVAPIAEDALGLYKSMPRGKLYEGVSVVVKGCVELGYSLDKGEDPCYPGLCTFFRNEEQQNMFGRKFFSTLQEYGEPSMDLERVRLLDFCKCKNNSYVKTKLGTSCDQADGIQSMVARKPFRAFVSSNKLWCGQASVNIAEDALSLFKTMPRGKLFQGESVSETGCGQLGYNLSSGEDPCYPGLQTFHRNEKEKNRFIDELQRTLQDYGVRKMPLEDVFLIDSCRCKAGSYVKNVRGESCQRAGRLQAKVTELQKSTELEKLTEHGQHTFVSTNKKWCAQAQAHVANDALSLYKSMPRAKLYDGVSTSEHTSCERLGYNRSAGEDPCYPGLQTFYRNEEEENQFVNEYEETLLNFGKPYGFSSNDVNLMDSCKCKVHSFAKKYRGGACDNVIALRERMETKKAKTVVDVPK